MLSERAKALERAIQKQDRMLFQARYRDAPVQFQRAIVAVRNEYVRDLAQEWRVAS